jgi:signal transduction histidine kinase
MTELERLKARLKREREARVQAEALLEDRSRDLYAAQEQLRAAHAKLRGRLEERTADLRAANEELRSLHLATLNMLQDMGDAQRAAESASASKSEFLANMSHELRTPLTAILGFTDLLVEECRRQPAVLEKLETISRNGNHLLAVINDILDLSKIEAGRMTIERVSCSPIEVVADILSLMQVRAQSRGLQLRAEYVGSIPERIETDPTRLRQVLMNLVGNAIKFTSDGGVRVIIRLAEAAAETAIQRLQFEVLDTGMGMSPAQVKNLFQAFSQADASITRRFGGTGLGLAVSRRLVQMLGGDIEVESEEGRGSCFRFFVEVGRLEATRLLDRLPEQGLARPVAPGRAPAGRSEPLGCRVLLAEDGPDNQRLITFILKKAGAEVTVVEDGQKAVERAEGGGFDVVLMDMMMPVMDGYKATRTLRDRGYAGPIIALTAHAMAGDREKCLSAGCDDYATKPVDREGLVETIRSCLAKSACGAGA